MSPAAVAEEMLGGRISAVVVLRAHVVDIHTVQAAGQQHQRRAEQVRKVLRLRALSRYQHDAVHGAFDQRSDEAMLQCRGPRR